MLQKPDAPSLLFKPIRPLPSIFLSHHFLHLFTFFLPLNVAKSRGLFSVQWNSADLLVPTLVPSFFFMFSGGFGQHTTAQGKPCFFFDSFKPSSLPTSFLIPSFFCWGPARPATIRGQFPASPTTAGGGDTLFLSLLNFVSFSNPLWCWFWDVVVF